MKPSRVMPVFLIDSIFRGNFSLHKVDLVSVVIRISGSCHKRQKPHAPTPQAPIRSRQMRKVENAKGLNRNTNLA